METNRIGSNEFKIDFHKIFQTFFHLSNQSNCKFSNWIEEFQTNPIDENWLHPIVGVEWIWIIFQPIIWIWFWNQSNCKFFDWIKQILNKFQFDTSPRYKHFFNVSDYILHLATTLLEKSTKKPYNKSHFLKVLIWSVLRDLVSSGSLLS